jgi:hypothetical protein
MLGLCDTSKGHAVGSVGRCGRVSLSRFDVGEIMFAVVSRDVKA